MQHARATISHEGETPPTPPSEAEQLARVVKAAIGILRTYWDTQKLPKAHPYRQAARMIESFLERRYGV